MNLHQVAARVVSIVKPPVPITVQRSTGYSTNPDGTPTQTYAAPVAYSADIQPITWRDLQQLDGINLNGVRWKAYISGQLNGVNRPEVRGGDLVNILAGFHQGVFLVAQVLEQFDTWVCAAIVQQNGS